MFWHHYLRGIEPRSLKYEPSALPLYKEVLHCTVVCSGYFPILLFYYFSNTTRLYSQARGSFITQTVPLLLYDDEFGSVFSEGTSQSSSVFFSLLGGLT